MFSSCAPPQTFHDGVVGLIREAVAAAVSLGGGFGERGEKQVIDTVGLLPLMSATAGY